MIILGIDPGTATTGYGVLEISYPSKDKIKYYARDYGLIETDKNSNPGDRLSKIHGDLDRIVRINQPDIIAIEKVFFATNAKTAIRVGQAQGVMLMCAAQNNVEVFEYSPMTIKKIVAGHGRADKIQIQKSIQVTLGESVRSKPKEKTHFDNAADALAVALCHAFTVR